MSKLQIAVIEALESGEWMTVAEIAAGSGFKKSSVSVKLTWLCGKGLVFKKDDPTRINGSMFKKGNTQCEFGVSERMSEFQRLIGTVRAANATERQHNLSHL
ncbi:MarR family transcriptional regulator [Erwinia endophytica]|uniref:MarR family transcriptional regulator n=1 Tax=Erwinia endophytica TaxID=1563158 RepID=UPI001265FCF8|nr:helix-turn-helix domain-containing protein [Erwinia endophytica]